jgi:hypothetical protein
MVSHPMFLQCFNQLRDLPLGAPSCQSCDVFRFVSFPVHHLFGIGQYDYKMVFRNVEYRNPL